MERGTHPPTASGPSSDPLTQPVQVFNNLFWEVACRIKDCTACDTTMEVRDTFELSLITQYGCPNSDCPNYVGNCRCPVVGLYMNLAMQGDTLQTEVMELIAPLHQKLLAINTERGKRARQRMAHDVTLVLVIPPVPKWAEVKDMAHQHVFAMLGHLCTRRVTKPSTPSKDRVEALTNQLEAARDELATLKETIQVLRLGGQAESDLHQAACQREVGLQQEILEQRAISQQLQQQLNALREQLTNIEASRHVPRLPTEGDGESQDTPMTRGQSPRGKGTKRNSTSANLRTPATKTNQPPTAHREDVDRSEEGDNRSVRADTAMRPEPLPQEPPRRPTYAAAVGKTTTNPRAVNENGETRDLLKHVKRFNTAMPSNDPKSPNKEIEVRAIQVSEKYRAYEPTELKEIGVQVVVKAGLRNVRNVHCSRDSTQILLFMDKADSQDNVRKLGALRIRAPRFSFLKGISEKTPPRVREALAKRMGYLLARTDYGPMRKAIRADLRKYQEDEKGIFRDLVDAVDAHEEDFRKSWKPTPRRC